MNHHIVFRLVGQVHLFLKRALMIAHIMCHSDCHLPPTTSSSSPLVLTRSAASSLSLLLPQPSPLLLTQAPASCSLLLLPPLLSVTKGTLGCLRNRSSILAGPQTWLVEQEGGPVASSRPSTSASTGACWPLWLAAARDSSSAPSRFLIRTTQGPNHISRPG